MTAAFHPECRFVLSGRLTAAFFYVKTPSEFTLTFEREKGMANDELEALGVDGTKITGELWRKRDGVMNPTVTIILKSSMNHLGTREYVIMIRVKSETRHPGR